MTVKNHHCWQETTIALLVAVQATALEKGVAIGYIDTLDGLFSLYKLHILLHPHFSSQGRQFKF